MAPRPPQGAAHARYLPCESKKKVKSTKNKSREGVGARGGTARLPHGLRAVSYAFFGAHFLAQPPLCTLFSLVLPKKTVANGVVCIVSDCVRGVLQGVLNNAWSSGSWYFFVKKVVFVWSALRARK